MYRNIFTSLIGVALLLICGHSAAVIIERSRPASGLQLTQFNRTGAGEFNSTSAGVDRPRNVKLPIDENTHGLISGGKDDRNSSVSNLFDGIKISGVGASKSKQGQFVDGSNGAVDGGSGKAGVTNFGKRRLSHRKADSTADSEDEQSDVETSQTINNENGDVVENTIEKQKFPATESELPENIEATGGDGNAQGQFGNTSNGDVEGGNGGGGVTLSGKKKSSSKKSHRTSGIVGKGGKGNAQGQFGDNSSGHVTGGNGGTGVSLRR
jgi:hypothetical protein